MITVDIRMDAAKAFKVLDPNFIFNIPKSIFLRAEDELRKIMAQKIQTIRRTKRVKRVYNVRRTVTGRSRWGSTYEWRLRMARLQRTVKTLRGQVAPVLPTIKAGMRTNTMLDQLEGSKSPTVQLKSGMYESDLSMVYSIAAGKYDRSYPIFFHQWIEEVKGIEGGLLPGDAEQERILDILSADLMSWFKGKA